MSETPKLYVPPESRDTVISHSVTAETGMDGADLAPVLDRLASMGKTAVEGTYDNPVVFRHHGKITEGQAIHRTDSGVFIVWPPIPENTPGQVAGDLGMVPLKKPYRIQAEDLRPADPKNI